MTRDPAEGVDADGVIVTGAASDCISAMHRPIVADCTAELQETFGDRLHSLYLYGSVATGQARPGTSDLDLIAVWTRNVNQAEVDTVEATLSARHVQAVRDVGISSATLAEVLADDRDGLGWRCFVRHYGVWLAGRDLRPNLPPCRASRSVADAFNDDVGALVRRWRTELAQATGDVAAIARAAARKLLLVTATLESAEHGGWTTDRATGAALLATHHPEWAAVAELAIGWCSDPGQPTSEDVHRLLDLGDWLADRP